MIVAHAGHWLANVLYAAPVLVVVGALIVSVMRERRRGEEEGEAGEDRWTGDDV